MFVHKGLMIRAIEEDDLSFLAECRNNPETWKYLGNIDFANKERQLQWWKSTSLSKDKVYYVLCLEDGTRIGFVRTDEIDHLNRSVRVGGDIHPNFRSQGYGTKMYELLLKYMFDYMNIHRVWLFVIGFNEVALGLYTKMGFILEGSQRDALYRDGKYWDYLMFGILENEYRAQ